jgi:hypothetical protein
MGKPPPFARSQHFHAGKKGKRLVKMIQIKIEGFSSDKALERARRIQPRIS